MLAVGVVLAASGALPPVADASAGGTEVDAMAVRDEPIAKVSARSGQEPLEMQVRQGTGDFATVMGSFEAQMSNRGRASSGRIRMEWGSAARERRTGVVVEVRIRQVAVSSFDVVTFSGDGTRTDRATGAVVEFPVTGSARRDSIDPDCVIFDIVGSGVHDGIVELPGRFDVTF